MAAAWPARLEVSLKKNKKYAFASYFQLATISEGATIRPVCRTVVYRGFAGETDNITFVTDQRSNKVREFERKALAEACWYFPNTREQYRLSGSITVVSQDDPPGPLQDERQHKWRSMSDPGRAQFAWPHPGEDRHLPDENWEPEAPAQDSAALDTFCLVILNVETCDYLSLKENRRFVYANNGKESGSRWDCKEVNP
ncbi:hypothetical protein WJX73_005396 [Symbiochloris irregularis]|uniref:Pyridoxamine 5'-phosphate oxidase Alr4036 family FMN-binding domain-containing protein n=1 Tax=Symbiochloris irregularis TaxID=706552 RepID=A0AAW1P3N3_9CHLO